MSTITIDLNWRGSEDATRLEWVADDNQSSLDGGALDPQASAERQAADFCTELMAQGHNGTGRIVLRGD